MSETAAKVDAIRRDFPVLSRVLPNGSPLIYLDNAATTQKPRQVIEAMSDFYSTSNSNVHRGVHQLAVEATHLYEDAHTKAARFVGGRSFKEMVFTRNCTEAINLVAHTVARTLEPGDEVVTTHLEHHSNLVPWQQACKDAGASLRFITLTKDGELDMEAAKDVIGPKTRFVTLTGASNTLGSVSPVREISDVAHDRDARVLVDAAQLVPHAPVDVAELGCDLLAFSGHKMLGPTGIGALWGSEEAFEWLQPYNFGGEMIRRVEYESSQWNDVPWRFEAGTPNIAEAVGLAAAIDYLEALGMDWVARREHELVSYAMERLAEAGCDLYGPGPDRRCGLIAFNVPSIHPHDLASLLDDRGIAVRAGHHCTMPLHELLDIHASTRASFYVYNTEAEIDALVEGVGYAREVMRV